LRRDPTSSELTFGTSALSGTPPPGFVGPVQTETVQQFRADLLGSNDYLNLAQSNPNGGSVVDKWIYQVFEDVLGRMPSASEVQAWEQGVNNLGLTQSAARIVGGDEAHTRLVLSWYASFLHRQGSSAELSGWANYLDGGGTEQSVIAGITGSAEFENRNF
jgi:hypothetical protein